jgi:hypothetical protein
MFKDDLGINMQNAACITTGMTADEMLELLNEPVTRIVENFNMREKLDTILLDSKQFASILSERTKAAMNRVYHNTRPNYLPIFVNASPTIGRKRRNRRARGRKLAANRQKACA